MRNRAKFGVGIAVIVASLAFLAWLGYGESKTYYHTIAEYQQLQGSQRNHRMRLAGSVAPNSIRRSSGRVDFVLEEQGKTLSVSYVGSEPLPDTFVDKSRPWSKAVRKPMAVSAPNAFRQNALPSMKQRRAAQRVRRRAQRSKATCNVQQ